MQRITITIDDDLMEKIDSLIKTKGYQNRSEALRDLARSGLLQEGVLTGEDVTCVGILSYIFDHEARELARRLTGSYHDHHDLSVSSLHVHLDHDRCLEVSILKGKFSELQQFSDSITAQRAVSYGGLKVIPCGPQHSHNTHK